MKLHSRTLTTSLAFALAGLAAAFVVHAGTEKKGEQTPVAETPTSAPAASGSSSVQMSAHSVTQLRARSAEPRELPKEQPKVVALEGAHWAGCEGSLAKAFSDSFLGEAGGSKAGFPRTFTSARLQILRSFPSKSLDIDNSDAVADSDAGAEARTGSAKPGGGSANATEDSQDAGESGLSEVQRCRVLGKVYAQLNSFVSNFDFAEPSCAENLKRWGVLVADVQCRTWELLPTLSPLPLLARAHLEKCVPADADNCLASFDLRLQNNAEKCGMDAAFRALPQAQFTRSRSCFYK